MIRLYGESKSRASRSLWAAEELGLLYEHIPVASHSGTRTREYLRINPNGHIPCLDDEGLVVWESMAINLYLAEKYGHAPLWPASIEQRAGAFQWSFWVTTEIERRLIAIALAARGDDAAAKHARAELADALAVLDSHLRERHYLLGSDFTIADLNVASGLREPHETGIANISERDLPPIPALFRWLDECTAREAYQRVRAMK